MADNLIFPIGFDLETAVKKAESEGASAMKRLENVFSRQPLALRLDNSGFEKYSTEFGKNIDQLKERLKELRTQFDAIPLNQKWEQNNGVKTLTAHAKELWDELLRITEILKGVGQGAQQMANQSIREIDKEIAALEKLKQKEIEVRQAKQTKQLQTEWNAAADQHKKDSLAEEKRLQEESNRIRKEAEATARREAEIEKLIVEHKLRQTQAEQAKKRASDEEYANLVKQLREEERLSVEKARQKALDMRRERQAEATAAIERERSARRQLFEAKREQWQAEQNAINSQSLSYDSLMAKLRAWQNIQNRNEVGSKRWEEASRAIQKTKEMLALVTEEMNRAAKAAERIRALREILAANERTMSGLNAKLAEYNTRLQGLDVGSAKFNKTAMEVARLNEELRRATQYAQDFAQKAFQGLSVGDTNRRVAELQMWRQQLQQVEEEYNRLRNYTIQNGSNASIDRQLNDLLKQRMDIVRNINQATLTAEQAQAEREKEINRIIEQRKTKADAIAAKRKAEQAAIQSNIAKLKEERRILNQQESSIANITAKLQIQQQRLQSAKFGSAEFEKIAKEVERLTAKLDKANQKVRELTGQTQSGAARQSAAVKQVNQEFKNQETYVSRLLKRMAVYASFSYASNFLTSVREVTAQFELQRVSLGAILQDANKGEQIFSQIKQFALNSPLSILDMTRYTKQLAAYKIEYDELFEMTKRFADISVGLGVDYQRIVLAAGQTRTATYLRASELKQFTELGVPLLEELSIKLSKMNGEMVSTAEVMDMISKRAISWELVKEVLYDMTDAGGMFYNMQIQQGNTLYGLWQKLGDAASVMYEQIGNTGWVNSGMKEAIQLLTELMRNWKATGLTVATTILPAVAAMAAWKMATKSLAKTVTAATNERIIAEAKLATAMKGTDIAAQNAARSTLAKAKADEAAAIAAQKHTSALAKLKMGLVSLGKFMAAGLGIGIAITLVTQLVYKISEAITNFRKLEKELGSIYSQTATLQDQSVRNFEYLADKAVKAANGSKEQKDALDELNRTYKDILPQESLTIENLSRMKDGYDELTQSIKEYIAEQQRQKAESAIFEYYGTKIRDAQNDVRERLYDQGLSATEVGRFFAAFEKLAPQAGKSTYQKFREAMLEAGVDDTKLIAKIWKKEFEFTQRDIFGSDTGFANITALTEAYADQADEIRGMNEEYREATGQLGEFDKKIKQTKESLQNTTYRYSDGRGVDTNTFLYQQMQANAAMKRVRDLILNDEDMKKAIQEKAVELQPEWLHLVDSVNPNDLMDITKVNFDAIIKAVGDKYPDLTMRLKALQKEWGNVIPADSKVQLACEKGYQIVKDAHGNIDKMSRFLMQSGEDWKTYVTRIKDEMESEKQKLKELRQEREKTAKWGLLARLMNPLADVKIDESEKKLEQLTTLFNTFKEFYDPDEKKNKGGRTTDPRLQTLQEIANKMAEVNKEYDELLKKEGQTKALADTQKLFASSFKQMEATAKKYGFKLPAFEVPQTIEDVQKWYKAIMDNIKRLNLKNADKVLIELGFKSDKAAIDKQQKDIEKQLKELADRISRTKTAKEFYEKILGQTGDVELAANLSLSIYGENGEDLDKAIRDNIQATLGKNKQGVDLDFSAAIRTDGSVDYNALTKIAKGYLDMGEISEDTYNKILKMRDEDRKDLAKTVEGWLKATEKAKTYSDKLLDLRRKTQAEIDSINEKERHGDITPEFAESQRAGFLRKEAEEVAKLQYEAFKDSPMYVQMFDDLDNASTTMLRNMKQRIEELKTSWKDLTPTQLKEMQSKLNEIDAQLAKRNPFKGLIDGIKEYRNLRKGGDDGLDPKSEREAEKALDTAAKARLEAEKEYLEILNKEGATQEEIAKAKEQFDRAAADEDAAAKALENWKKVKDAIGLSANELFQMLNWAGDIAKGIADISEAMGADEEDVQYWNNVADALGQISGGIQDIVSAAMSGNVVGIISSTLTAIPKMFVGFTNLFSAGKVRKANKEIKRQAELLEQLDYTYGRLEKAADKVFGRDYLNNYNQQLKVLQAQQQAYLKQAEAERSKGKKADKDKIKEYEEQARETADAIKDLQDDLVAHFTGSSRTDVARQMAKSWIEARASMSDTFAAIKGDYAEMIKNMIVEGAAARVIENALTPMWEDMDKMLKNNDVEGAIDSLVNGMDAALTQANNGMEVLWKALEARGYDMKKLISDTDSEYTGIAKNIAGATSEEINTAAAIGNTIMYHTSHLPIISQNVAAIYELMSQGKSSTISAASTGWTDWQQQAMENYNAIARNTADTVVRCERAAVACEAMAEKMGRIIVPKGGKFAVNTTYI